MNLFHDSVWKNAKDNPPIEWRESSKFIIAAILACGTWSNTNDI
jgi:hypothetical protein